MTELIYLTDSYQKELTAHIVSCEKHGNLWEILLDKTIFYPEGGGQPSDRGEITNKTGKAHVKHVRMKGQDVVHECTLEGTLKTDDSVHCTIDWKLRYHNMRVHSGGHIVHEAVKMIAPTLIPTKGHHGDDAYIEYKGSLPIDKKYFIEQAANQLIERKLPIKTEFVSLEELQRRTPWAPEHLPKNKPLRILSIGDLPPIPDGGTQVRSAEEVGPISIIKIDNEGERVRVYYEIASDIHVDRTLPSDNANQIEALSSAQLTGLLLDAQQEALDEIADTNLTTEQLRLHLLGGKSRLSELTKQIRFVPAMDRQSVGIVVTQVKDSIQKALGEAIASSDASPVSRDRIDVTQPGTRPPEGHLHIVTQAISEITRIFERIGFTRVRHPEVDWDWYAFGSLNMPPNHPARDEWETFFLDFPGKPSKDPHKQKMVLTPHTSNGQVREMEKRKLPLRMINIAKCYRRQIDVSHTPMFHQFEGLYVDQDVSIAHLKGVLDYFAKSFFGPNRNTRLRPFHFQFTEPSFEVDITCGICNGTGKLANGEPCKLCKSGWLELGGAGMVHPVVLQNGGVDPKKYSGFAFGWGVERTYMMKSGTQLDDIRLLYSNDVRFLEQF